MRKFLFLLFLFFSVQSLFSQELHHNFMIGGNADFEFKKKITVIEYSPNIGFFVVKNLAVGIGIEGFYQEALFSTFQQVTVTPFIRYYIGQNKIKGFAEIGYGNFKEKYQSNNSLSNEINYSIWKGGVGGNYFITSNIALEVIGKYKHHVIKDPTINRNIQNANGFQVQVGLQFYLRNQKK